jgi:hypothetical protein
VSHASRIGPFAASRLGLPLLPRGDRISLSYQQHRHVRSPRLRHRGGVHVPTVHDLPALLHQFSLFNPIVTTPLAVDRFSS